MSVFSIFAIGYLIVKTGKYFLDVLSEQPKTVEAISEPRKHNVKYYSEGRLLPNPFHEEYLMIANTVADSWIYKDQHQDYVKENHDAPIVEIQIFMPFKYQYCYTFKHVFLANAYLIEQKEYLESVN